MLLSYLVAALIAVIMVFSLSEMAVVHPVAGSFGTYAEIYLGSMMGFVVRYTYWFQQILLIGSEAIAVGVYMGYEISRRGEHRRSGFRPMSHETCLVRSAGLVEPHAARAAGRFDPCP